MKANELRIGNKVHILNEFEVIVVGIYNDEIITNFDGNEADFFQDKEKDVNGIPLTEEWLERLGFEFYDYVLDSDEDIDDNETGIYKSYKKQPDGKKYYYSVNFNSDNTIEFTIKVQWADEMVLSLIKHVHTLQNLYFALTGEELQIKK